LYADYSDPDVIRVGDDFYMTASSFNCTPGLQVLHSKDLVNWTLIGHALPKQMPAQWYNKPQHGDGVWAPAIRYHKGAFYIYYPDPDFGIYVVKAQHPAGPWSEPVLVDSGRRLIDPCPLWDDDGNAYLVHGWAASRAEINSILTVKRLSPDGMKAMDAGVHVFDGHGKHPTLEGPKLYTATTVVKLTADIAQKQAGLIVMGGDYAYVALKREGDTYTLCQVICKGRKQGPKKRNMIKRCSGKTGCTCGCR